MNMKVKKSSQEKKENIMKVIQKNMKEKKSKRERDLLRSLRCLAL